MASLVAGAIRREGHTVVRAGSVASALALTDSFDHAVLDVDLPDGTGVQLAQELLAERRAQRVIFFTASRDVGLLARAASMGLVVDKTAGYDGLIAAVRRIVELGQAGKRAAIAGSAQSVLASDSARSGTRRKVDSE